jgi:hypothetical protein
MAAPVYVTAEHAHICHIDNRIPCLTGKGLRIPARSFPESAAVGVSAPVGAGMAGEPSGHTSGGPAPVVITQR